jgi:hypothetical protein
MYATNRPSCAWNAAMNLRSLENGMSAAGATVAGAEAGLAGGAEHGGVDGIP